MRRGMRTSTLVLTLCLVARSFADTVQYFYSHELDTCYWGASSLEADNNTAHGGLCAYVGAINRLYACPAPDRTCWTFAQNCANGQNPGSRQIKCSNTVYDEEWCCQEQETCTPNADQYNVCISQFLNPNRAVTPADAEDAEYSIVPSSAIGTDAPAQATPSVFSSSVYAAVGDDTSTSASSSSSPTSSASASNTQSGSQTRTSTGTADSSTSSSGIDDSHSHISTGAIVGIVVGVLGGLAIICGTIIFIILHRRRSTQPHNTKDSSLGNATGAGAGAGAYATKQNEKHVYTDSGYYQPTSPYSDNDAYKGGYMQFPAPNYLVEAPSNSQGALELSGNGNARANGNGSSGFRHELA